MNSIVLVQVRLRTEVLSLLPPSLTRPGFALMICRSWQYISCHWDAALTTRPGRPVCSKLLKSRCVTKVWAIIIPWSVGTYWRILPIALIEMYFWFKYDFRTELLCTTSSTRLGFELMTSRSWQYISGTFAQPSHLLLHPHLLINNDTNTPSTIKTSNIVYPFISQLSHVENSDSSRSSSQQVVVTLSSYSTGIHWKKLQNCAI